MIASTAFGSLPAALPGLADARPPPEHVAIIMDGNGRWAAARGLPRAEGHRRGVEAVRAAIRAASDLGISVLTLYSFSLENWSRPLSEVNELMNLLRRFIREDLAELNRNNVRIKVIGERGKVAGDIARMLAEAVNITSGNTGLQLVVAFNYGSRQEMADAARRIAADVERGALRSTDITPDLFESRLFTAGMPDPDLVIRTSGEQRLSNFLLWQAAYSEFVFLPVLWPDFDGEWLKAAVQEYRCRDRRFGGTAAAAE